MWPADLALRSRICRRWWEHKSILNHSSTQATRRRLLGGRASVTSVDGNRTTCISADVLAIRAWASCDGTVQLTFRVLEALNSFRKTSNSNLSN